MLPELGLPAKCSDQAERDSADTHENRRGPSTHAHPPRTRGATHDALVGPDSEDEECGGAPFFKVSPHLRSPPSSHHRVKRIGRLSQGCRMWNEQMAA